MLFSKLVLLSLYTVASHSQLIGMNVCSDDKCSKSCISWTATNSFCSPCNGVCSITNPSSITTTDSLTLYSDSNCYFVIPNTDKIPIRLDNTCHLLNTGDSSVRYYRGVNISNIIGYVSGGVIGFIVLISCLFCFCKKSCCFKTTATAPPPNTIVVIEEPNQQQITYLPPQQQQLTYFPQQQQQQLSYFPQQQQLSYLSQPPPQLTYFPQPQSQLTYFPQPQQQLTYFPQQQQQQQQQYNLYPTLDREGRPLPSAPPA